MMLRTAGALALAVAALGAATTQTADEAGPTTTQHRTPDIPSWVTRPCQTEDSVNCRWIASGPHAQGNGHGHSFVAREVPGSVHMVCVFYAERGYARHHDYCA